jgi:DNA-directed RNA polymerase specialized sigma24 family protein
MSSQPTSAFSPDLRAALIAMVRKRVPESEVEDIVQSTLADAIESPHAPTDSESLRRWIFGVAKNKVVDYHRRAGRETFDMPEVAGKPAPHAEADLLRWAEKHLPPGEENKTTLDWMLREGEGEKLEWIAETEKVPAPRVRQRVSRLRRHLKTHWQKEVALLATLGVLITIFLLVLKKKEPEPIANENLPRAAEIRKVALEKCAAADWKDCVEKLDQAKQLDPAGDTRPEVRRAREDADKALSVPPVPTTENLTPPPDPTATVAPPDSTLSHTTKDAKEAPRKQDGKTAPNPKSFSTDATPSPAPPSSFTPAPKPTAKPQQQPSKMKGGGGSSSLDFDSEPTSKPDGFSKSAPPASKGTGGSKSESKKKVDAMASKSKANAPVSKQTVGSVNVKPAINTVLDPKGLDSPKPEK